MVVRLVRAGVGVLLLLIAGPLAFAGGGLWVAMEHRAADKTFTAQLERVRSDGHAVVVPDVDALLRADAPFARGGQTTLALSAHGSGGPVFIGLGPDGDVERYLDGLAQSRLTRVRPARGPLPVEVHDVAVRPAPVAPTPPAPVDATGAPVPAAPAPAAAPLPAPAEQTFWLARGAQAGGATQLTWSPSAMRGKHLALVIMNADGAAGLDLALTARLSPAWLAPTTGGLIMLAVALFLLALFLLLRPQRRAAEPVPLPTLPTLPTLPAQATSAARGRSMLRRNLAGSKDQLAAMFNQNGRTARDADATAPTTETTVVIESAVIEPAPTANTAANTAPEPAAPTGPGTAADTGSPAPAGPVTAPPADRNLKAPTARNAKTLTEPAAKAPADHDRNGDAAAADGARNAKAPAEPAAKASMSTDPAAKAPAESTAKASTGADPKTDPKTGKDTGKDAGKDTDAKATADNAVAGSGDGEQAAGGDAVPAAKKMVVASEAVLATLADVLAAADLDAARETARTAEAATTAATAADGAGGDLDPATLAESELDRPAPVGTDPDDHGAFDLPPLPAMPAIELQFTWAPIALDETEDRDPASSGSTARS